jgi:pilus assembly protein CpaE
MYPLTIGLVLSSSDLWEAVQAELATMPVRVVIEQAVIDDLPVFIDKLDRFKPEIVLLDPSQLPDELTEVIKGIRSSLVSPHVVVVRNNADATEILTAMRAGASEYVCPPFATNLKEALERVSKQRQAQPSSAAAKSATSFGFLSVKGGCGATTLACHAAIELGRASGKSTLLADLDFVAGSVRVVTQAKSRYSMIDALENVQRLDTSFWRGLVHNGTANVEIIASLPVSGPRRMPGAHEIRQVLRFVRSQYDYVVVDLGHGFHPGVAAALEEVDHLLLVSTMEMPALQQTKVLLREIPDLGYSRNRIHLVLNRVPRRGEISVQDVEGGLGVEVFGTIPNDYRALDVAYSEGRLLPEDHYLRQEIGRLLWKLADIEVAPRKKKFNLFNF